MGKDWRSEEGRVIALICEHCGDPCQCVTCGEDIRVVAAVMRDHECVDLTVKCGCGEAVMPLEEAAKAGARNHQLGVH